MSTTQTPHPTLPLKRPPPSPPHSPSPSSLHRRSLSSASSPQTHPTPHSLSPSPPPHPSPTFSSLPEEVVHRIISHLLSHSLRGTPYYPPSASYHLLPLSEVSTSLRSQVFRCLTSDIPFLNASLSLFSLDLNTSDFEPSKMPAAYKYYILSWYRLCGAHLETLTISKAYFSPVEDVLPLVAGFVPRLHVVDLSGIEELESGKTDVENAVRSILTCGRESIRDLQVSMPGWVAETVKEVGLVNVNVLKLRWRTSVDGIEGSKEEILRMVSGVNGGKGVKEVGVSIFGDVGKFERGDGVVRGVGKVTVRGCVRIEMGDVKRFVKWVRAWEGVEEIVLRDVFIEEGEVMRILGGGIGQLRLERCDVGEGVQWIEKVGRVGMEKVRELELSRVFEAEEVREIGKYCSGVECLGLRFDRGAIWDVARVIEMQERLERLDIWVCGGEGEDRNKERWEIIGGLLRGEFGLKKVMIRGESLPVQGVRAVLDKFCGTIEYMVVGLEVEYGVSMSEAIIELLNGVVRKCRGMKILCFGLNLVYDCRAEEVHDRLMKSIEEVEQVCRGLDTVWLKRNARSLLAIPRPSS